MFKIEKETKRTPLFASAMASDFEGIFTSIIM